MTTPGLVLANFTNDWMDPARPDEQILEIARGMVLAPRHTYITLTKQAQRLACTLPAVCADLNTLIPDNWFIGLTIRNQAEADERLEPFLAVRAHHVWLSLEPIEEAIDLAEYLPHVAGVIVGHDNRAKAKGTHDFLNISTTINQCRAYGVPCYTKQAWVFGKLMKNNNNWSEEARQLPWTAPKETP
jgi:protein gp37